MSWQPLSAIAQLRAPHGLAIAAVAVNPQLRDSEPSRDPERWSG